MTSGKRFIRYRLFSKDAFFCATSTVSRSNRLLKSKGAQNEQLNTALLWLERILKNFFLDSFLFLYPCVRKDEGRSPLCTLTPAYPQALART